MAALAKPLIRLVFLSITTLPTVTLSKETSFLVAIVISLPVFVTLILSPSLKVTVSPPFTVSAAAPLTFTFQAAVFLITCLPALSILLKSFLAALLAVVVALLI